MNVSFFFRAPTLALDMRVRDLRLPDAHASVTR
jgi:hypothetical protein